MTEYSTSQAWHLSTASLQFAFIHGKYCVIADIPNIPYINVPQFLQKPSQFFLMLLGHQ